MFRQVRDVNAELTRLQRLQQLCLVEEAGPAARAPGADHGAIGDGGEAAKDGVEHDSSVEGDDVAECRRVSGALRSCKPYLLKTLDHEVAGAVARLASSRGVPLKQWARHVDLPLSAAVGSWYTCKKDPKHVFSRTGVSKDCPKCPKRS